MLEIHRNVDFDAARPPDVEAVSRAWNMMITEAERAYASDARFGRSEGDASDGYSSLIGSAAGPSFFCGLLEATAQAVSAPTVRESTLTPLQEAAEAALRSLDSLTAQLYAGDRE